ncbi:glucosamine-6-phosphate deaminase [Compostibacter hankyongensis]|uniref:Glucosamine-6-phosphate deaminase n=1 Tax=Compostibacter hankyongensis TaxID=1007089 RepID=A0ABP8FJ12_9BACT
MNPKPNTADIDLTDSFEKIPVQIFKNAREGSESVARTIAALIREKQAAGKPCVLGLATGSTPKNLYAELVRMHQEEELSFEGVITFNLDEYYPIEPDALQSYHRFMQEQLFNHVDIRPENIHIPDGTLPKDQVKAWCLAYEEKIAAAGGIDLQILGIGNNGHIGFNEPGSNVNSRTRLIALENTTRLANSYEFSNMAQVPRLAITMGISNILLARKVILLAWGQHKAPVVQRAVEGHNTEQVPASVLQQHPDCTFVLDEQAAAELTRFKSPWLTGECEWTPKMIRKAVSTLALSVNKPILMLTDNDYNDHGLSDLLVHFGPSYDINLMVFNGMKNCITGWPGGKPHVHIPNHPERSEPASKRVILFSPHPDDDIISMGGTFIRLHEQGHEVHLGYQTSGNIAVGDEFVTRFIDFVAGFDDMFGIDKSHVSEIMEDARAFLRTKRPSDMDTTEIRAIKGLIRRCEAKATCRYVGIPDDHIHFLNLPFYETGKIEKNPPGEEDIRITMDLIRRVKPHQIYAAGDLADPHGTHKICLDIVFEAIDRLKQEEFMKDCWVWLYRGAWAEWEPYEIEMAVPMSPGQVIQKRNGIFIHQSQKDNVPFQGSDAREFWQRAEERNAFTAQLYDRLGLPHYAALEAFVRHHF